MSKIFQTMQKTSILSQSELRLPLLQVVSSNKYFSVGVQSPTEINAPRGCAVILKRRCQLALTRITHQVSRAFDLKVCEQLQNLASSVCTIFPGIFCGRHTHLFMKYAGKIQTIVKTDGFSNIHHGHIVVCQQITCLLDSVFA